MFCPYYPPIPGENQEEMYEILQKEGKLSFPLFILSYLFYILYSFLLLRPRRSGQTFPRWGKVARLQP
jgi:hypothetical protein